MGSRTVPERVKLYQPPFVLQEIANEGDTIRKTLREELTRQSAPPLPPRSPWYAEDPEVDSLRERIRQQRAIREQAMRRQEEAFQASLVRKAEAEARQRDDKLQSLLGDVLSGLQDPNSPLLEADEALAHAEKVRRKKKESLYDEWNTKVFDTIQGRLQQAVDSRDPRQIESRLKEQYDQYLHTTNTKVGVFRDVIIEEDYNPLTAAAHTIRVPTGDIKDPVKRDLTKAEVERQLMSSSGALLGGTAGSLAATRRSASAGTQIGKDMLDTRQWGELAIGATPFGHCTDGTGAYVVRPLSGSAVQLRASRVPMDHYTYPRGNAAAAAEAPPGKRIVPGPEQRRGRQDLFDVVHHTCHMKPTAYTGGDRWLEHKGKANAPGPEQRRGRRDLTDVLQQKAAQEGAAKEWGTGQPLGDVWLDAKGKGQAEGPEMRRGRQGLYETIHQTSNPYRGGSKVGDSWLEHKGRRVLPPVGPPEAAAVLSAVPPPPAARRPPDERKYGSQLVALEGQLTGR
ncbi:hypothetical protein HYH03_006523 [Edaphochlamys debaryana]|uniref:Uncharacterized protein n=1 Tax=Edaphochlamys debaryana TaxID=47281 RepID=A0A836C019_9CHLO|nr:hypothetical protein HYH03_006523 [Edaphochlamys debaryana]|eukprot:KAG2495250.1 hypothetical protein HYH03_006523 [Edaphochlamys debaryana]